MAASGKWSVPLLWPGSTVAVLASGPSMSQEVAKQVRHLPSVVVNNTFKLSPWSQVLYAADSEWWQNTPEALKFEGIKVTIRTPVHGVNLIGEAGKLGYSDRTDELHTYGNSGAQAIQLAAKAGARRILLCGFDMRPGHWHKEHRHPLRTTPEPTYERWIERFTVLAAALQERGIDVVNCTPGSAITAFRTGQIEEFV